MKFRENYLVFILFVLIMLSLGTVAASENVISDDSGNNDLISLSVHSTLEVDDGDMQNNVNELLLKTNDNETHSSGDVLKVSNDSPLRAGPSGTFNDIQTSINNAKSGDTVYLNGTKYTGNKQITINKNITIDGASESNSNEVSILDANSASRIFYNSGNYNIVLKNLVFENPLLSSIGYCAYFTGGNLTIQNLTIRNINGTCRSYYSAIYLNTIGSTLNVSNLTYNNNSINYNYNGNVNGILLRADQSSNVEINNLNIYDNNISASKNFQGFVYVDKSSNVSIANVNFSNNCLDVTNTIRGGFLLVINGTCSISNITFDNNTVLNYMQFYSFIRAQEISNVVLTDVHFYRNYMSGSMNYGSILSAVNCNASVNYCYIEDNCVNDSYDGKINQAGFITIQGMGTVNQCHSLNNYVNNAFGGILRLQTLKGYEMSYLENSTFVNTTLGASDITLDLFNPSDHGGVLCVEGADGVTVGTLIRNCSFINNCNSLGGAITPHNHCIIENCTFINNTATKYYGGAISTFYGNLTNLTTDQEITVKDCYFEGNTAPLGGAIQANGDDVHIYDCIFVNNTACKGGAVFLFGNTIDLHNCSFTDNIATDDIPEVLVGKLHWGIFDWNVEGGAVYIYGNSSDLYNNTFRYNEAIGENSDGCGGAIYVFGDSSTIDKSHFDDNFAHGGNGSAINIYGQNTTVKNSEFFNHTSVIGTVYIIGNKASVLNSTFEHNIASYGGGAVFIVGNYSLLNDDTFNDNNATVHGGAVYIMGNNAIISNSDFLSNNAIPHPEDIEQGLGGAIFINGNYNEIIKSLFDKNTARNGSAIYNRGHHVHINDDKFLENQAFSYLLNITATPKVSYHNGSNQVLINVTLVGGDNIINAIHNDGIPDNMFFYNVTYEHSTGVKTTPKETINPVDGAENSQGGKLLYQDSREDYQNVTLLVVKEKNSNSGLLTAPAGITGDVILDGMYKTGLYGNISILLTDNLTPGNYSAYAEHPEDRLYKQIDNSTTFEIIPQVDLEITKVVSNSTPNYQDEITWTITVINHGHSVAENVIVEDKLPDGLVYLSDDSMGEYNSTTGIWKIGDLAHNEDAVIVIRTLVNITNTTITNVAVVKTDTYDANDTNNEDNDTITVDPIADLAIDKTVSPHYPKAGETVIWTITVKNNGPDTAVNAFVRDVLPAGLEFIKSDGNYANNIWHIGDMANGDTAVLHIETKVLITDAVITNVANVTSDTPDSDLTNNEDNATIDIGHEADLSIVKVVSNPTPKFGDNITWTITVTNNGPDRAIATVVVDALPNGLVYVSDDSNGAYDKVKGVWTIGTLQNKESVTLNIVSRVNITNATITNVAVVESDTHDPNETNNKDNDTITVGNYADLAIEKIVSNHSPKMGETVTWTITVKNNGPDTAVNAFVYDVLPAGLKFTGSDGNYANNIWHIGDMANGDTAILHIYTEIEVYEAVITNVANVTSDTPDYDLTNNEDNTTIDVGHEADLSIVKVVSNSTPRLGENITWTITVTNNGPDRAIDIVVNDVLPNGLVYIADDSNGTYDKAKGVWTIGTLQNKASATLNILTQVNITNATITNVANVTSDTYDPDLSNNVDNDSIEVTPEADLEITKVVSNSNPEFNSIVVWTITVFNHGPDSALNVIVRDILPDGLVYVSDDSDGKYNPQTGIWDVGELHHGRGLILNIETLVNVTNSTIDNIASVNSTTYDPNETNNKDNDTITVDPYADLAIEKTVSPHYPKAGETVIWTITVTNNGPDTAVNAFVRDVLPAGLEFIESDGNYTNNIWYIGDIANGEPAVLHITTKVLVTDAVITNVANVTSDTPDVDLTNNEDNATIDIGHEADLSIVKVVSNSTPHFGDIITWTITVTNNGPDRAIDIVVNDVLPNGLVYIADDSNGTYAGGIWTIGTLQNKANATLNILTQVNITNATITNVAVVESDTHDPNETNNKDNDTITVGNYANLAIDKTVSPHYPKAGETVIWTITVTNNGPDTAVNAFVRDVLPAGLEFIESDGNYTNNIWYIGNMTNGATAVLNIKTRILVTDAVITNVANVTSDTPDLDLTNNEDNATIDIGHEADLSIVKVVSNSTPYLGDIITWIITVTNNGPDRAINVVVYDVLPEGLKVIESDGVFSDNMWYVGVLANGEPAVLHIKTEVLVSNATITNIANVTSDTHDSNLTNNVGNDTIVVPPQANLSIVKDVNTDKASIHDIIVWTITLTNNGPDTAENVVVNEKLPSGLKLLSAVADVGSYKDGVWNVGSLNSGNTVTLKLTTEVTILNGTLENIVNVTTSTYDPNKDNKNDSEIVNVSTIADLELTVVSNKDEVNVGDEFIWTITVVNHGPNVALNTIATYYVNGDVEFIEYEASKGTFDSSNNLWTIGDLDIGEKVTLKLVYKALNTGIASVYANTSCDTPETTMANNNDTSVVKIITINPDPESNETEVTERNKSIPSSTQLAEHQTGNPMVIIILALLSIVFVRLKRE